MWAMPLNAAKIGDLSDTRVLEQALRFVSLADPAVRYALLGSILLGITCGLLGSFLVVRRMALVGDALSHAVLPGVALGFLWNMSKDPVAIFIGATLAGLLGTAVVFAIKRTTHLKEDTALGMVLAGFFSVGICLVTLFQKLPMGNKSGIDKFLFGQAAALGPDDLRLMLAVAVLAVGVVTICYKEFLLVSFDPSFASVCALPTRWLQHALMVLLAFAVVIALQAVGVVLVSAMLITPAATAYLLTDRLQRMLWISALLGMTAGVSGAFFSFLGSNLSTGPFMVLAATFQFCLAFLFAPQRGVLVRWWRQRSQERRIARENTLKAIYHIFEQLEFRGETIAFRELAEKRRITLEMAAAEARALADHQFATIGPDGESVSLTPSGWQRACAIVRNHRLWELYLTHAASIAPDHVHDEAEIIEHVLGEDVVRELERRLSYARQDPHGKPIPSIVDVVQGGEQRGVGITAPGYRRPDSR
jgi:manganese/zinc/iron transport system permease protein